MNSYWGSNPYETEESWLMSMQGQGASGGADVADVADVSDVADVADAVGAAGAMSGNPYAIAVSGGLKVLDMVAKRKAEERKAKYMAQLDHKDNIRGALDKLIGVIQGLRNL